MDIIQLEIKTKQIYLIWKLLLVVDINIIIIVLVIEGNRLYEKDKLNEQYTQPIECQNKIKFCVMGNILTKTCQLLISSTPVH